MIVSGYTVSFISYAIPLLFFSGIMILRIDAAGFKKNDMKKEQKFSWFLGLTNIALALLLFVVRSVFF